MIIYFYFVLIFLTFSRQWTKCWLVMRHFSPILPNFNKENYFISKKGHLNSCFIFKFSICKQKLPKIVHCTQETKKIWKTYAFCQCHTFRRLKRKSRRKYFQEKCTYNRWLIEHHYHHQRFTNTNSTCSLLRLFVMIHYVIVNVTVFFSYFVYPFKLHSTQKKTREENNLRNWEMCAHCTYKCIQIDTSVLKVSIQFFICSEIATVFFFVVAFIFSFSSVEIHMICRCLWFFK